MRVIFENANKLLWMLGMVLVLTFTGCLDNGDPVEPDAVAYVSIYHASPDAPSLDVVLDNKLIFNQPLKYTDNSSYLRFYPGNRELEFSPFNANNVLLDTIFNFQMEKVYSVFVTGEDTDLSALILVDSLDAPAAGKAMVRFVHLSPDAPAVDFYVGDGDTPLAEDQGFQGATGFTEVDADTYALSLTAAGGSEALVSVPAAVLKDGYIYTIIARGFLAPPAGNTNNLSIQIIRNQ